MRRAALALLVSIPVLALPAPASAGGAWLYPDRQVYLPGETATLGGSFSKVAGLEGRPADGPWFAYLLPQERWILRDRIPPIAIPIGELEVLGANDGPNASASISFRIPDLATGWYHVGYCNDPCTLNGMGDLIGSQGFVIAPSRLEGKAFIRIDRLQARLSSARERTVGWRDRVAVLERVNDGLERIYSEQARSLESVQSRISVLQAELEMAAAAAAAERATPREMDVTLWIAGLAALVGLVLGFVGARRRRAVIVVPDTVPDDLLEREEAARR